MRFQVKRNQPTTIEFNWSLKQLEALGMIKVNDKGNIALLDAGVDQACVIETQLNVQERILLMLLYCTIDNILQEE